MKQDLARFHDSSQAQLTEGLRRYLEFQEPEDLHNLRLSIKKLRVFYGFLSPLNDKLLPAAIEFLEVSDIVFRYGGRRRDVYIQQQHLGRLELSLGKPFPEYHDFLGDTAHRREVKLQEILKSQPLLNVLPHGKLISNTLGSMSERALERHFRREAGQLYEAFRFRCQEWASDGDPEHLHKARRELKALMYLLNMAGKSKARISGRFRLSTSMKSIEQVIGKWHDHAEALHRLLMYMKKFPPRAKRRREFELLEGKMALLAGEALQEALRAAAKVQQESGSQRVNAWA